MNSQCKKVLRSQLVNELTESEIYRRLAMMQKDDGNREILERIAADESAHAQIISELLGEKGAPRGLMVARVVFNARIFGLTFALKLMEKGENNAGKVYQSVTGEYPQLARIAEDEERHEAAKSMEQQLARVENMNTEKTKIKIEIVY